MSASRIKTAAAYGKCLWADYRPAPKYVAKDEIKETPLKRTRRVEVIRYSRRVTVIESSGAINEAAITELPIIDIGPEQEFSISAAGELSEQTTRVEAFNFDASATGTLVQLKQNQRKEKKMKSTFLKTIGGVTLAVVLLTVFASQKALSDQNGGGRLEGTWDVQVTLRNCQTGDALRPPFPEVITFMFGGTMIDSTSVRPQSLKTPGQGVFSHVNGNTYRFSFKSLNFDSGGTFTGSTKVTHEATLNSDATEYTSVGTAEVYDVNGNLISTGCSTTTATRFE